MPMKVPTPVTQGAAPLGDIIAPPKQTPYLSNSYPTPPVKDVSSGANWLGAQLGKLGGNLIGAANTFQKHYDQAKLLEAEKDYFALEKELNDPVTGLATLQGMNAVGAAEMVQQRLDQFRADHNYDGMSASGKRAMDSMLASYDARAVGTAQQHEFTEVERARDNELSAGLNLQVDRAALSPATDIGNQEFDAAVSQIQQKVENYGIEKGWTAAQIEEKQREYTSAAVMARVAQIADGTLNGGNWQPLKAQEELKDALAQGQISTDDYNKMFAAVDKAVVEAQGQEEGAIGRQKSFEALHGIAASAMTTALTPPGGALEGTRTNPGTIPTGLTPGFKQAYAATNHALRAEGLGQLTITSGYRSSHDQAGIVAHASWAAGGDRLAHYGLDSKQYQEDWARLRKEAQGEGPETAGSKELAAIQLGQLWYDRLVAAGVNSAGDRSVAAPGYSRHNHGNAADMRLNGRAISSYPAATQARVREIAAANGITMGLPDGSEKWHGTLTGSPTGSVAEVYGVDATAPMANVNGAAVAPGGQTGLTVGNLKMIGLAGGTSLTVGGTGFYQGGGSNAHLTTDANGNPTSYHSDWSQYVGVYYAGQQRGPHDTRVGSRNGQPVWRAPDYARGPDGKYLMVSGDEALKIIQDNGWLVPNQKEWEAAAAIAQHYAPGRKGYPHADEPDQVAARARHMENVDAWRSGLPADTMVMYGKEFITDTLPGVEAQAVDYGNWKPGALPAGANADRTGYILQRFTQAGINPVIAAGIIGSLMGESSTALDTTLVNGIGAAGMAQWYKERRTALNNFAAAQGKPWTDLDVQLDFLLNELGIGEGASGSHKHVYAMLRRAKTPEEAARIWTLKFEIPYLEGSMTEKEKRNLKQRGAWARSVYGGGGVPTGIPAPNGQMVPGTPPGLDAGAAYVYNLPTNTPRERAIRASAMDYYTKDQAFINQQQNLNSAALLDDGYTRIMAAGVGSNFYQLFSPEDIRQLGNQVDSLINFHEKISTGQTVQTDSEVFFKWRELAYDDPDAFVDLYQNAENREFLMGVVSPEDRAVLDNIYTTNRANQAAAKAGQATPKLPGDTFSIGEAASYAQRQAEGMGLKGQELAQYVGAVAVRMVDDAVAKATETGLDIKGTVPITEAYDRATQMVDAGQDKPQTMTDWLRPVKGRPDLTYADTVFEDADELIDELTTGTAGMVGGIDGRVPWHRDDLELIKIGYENDNSGRTPTPGQLLEQIVYWTFLKAGDTAYTPVSLAGRKASRAFIAPPRNPNYVPYEVPKAETSMPDPVPAPGVDPAMTTYGLGALPGADPAVANDPNIPPPGEREPGLLMRIFGG